MASARGMWDAAKHPHGVHGHWAPTGGGGKHRAIVRRTSDRERVLQDLAAGNRSPSAFRPHDKASERRAKKRRIQEAVEVPRGAREPRTQAERDSLEWQAPAKRAAQRALTGDVRMPRMEAVRREASIARGYHDSTVGTTRTFTGKKRRVRDLLAPRGAKLTSRGRYNLARYGRD